MQATVPRNALLGALLALTALAALAVPPAAPQAATSTTWYVHGMTGPDGAGSYIDLLPPGDDEVDQTTTNTAAIGGDPQVTHSETKGPFPDALVKGSGDSRALVWVKSWNNGPAPATVVTVTISAGDTAIASGSLTQDVLAGAIVEYDIPLTLAAESVPAGSVLKMDVTLQDETCACYNPFAYPRGTSQEHPWQFTLALVPGSGGAAGPETPEVLDGAAPVALNLTFANATSTTRSYSWNTTLSEAQLTVAAAGEGGLALNVTDGNGTVVAVAELDGTGNRTVNITGAAPGNWSIAVRLTDFNGTLDLQLGPMPAVGSGNSTSQTGTGNATSSGPAGDDDRTGTFPLRTTDKGAPGVGLPGLVPALLVAAAVAALGVRRRL